MIVCRRCQRRNRADARRCAKCNAPLEYTDALGLAANPKQLVGKIINGKYEVLDVLGEGGMGVVYKVRHLILEKRNIFALKILHPRFSGDERFRKRFMREVEVAMDLTHENIVQIREFGLIEGGLLFFTMDFFDGALLSDVIRKEGRFDPRRVARIATALLLALDEAHGNGVVHRDLKPDNILIRSTSGGDKVRVLDFGIAKMLEGDGQSDLTADNIVGTPKYISPEQASGEPLDARSDLYSLGIVLYEMVTGNVPFSKGTARSILLAQMTARPPPFKKIAPKVRVPPRLEAFIFRLLAKDPNARPASARECIGMLCGGSRARGTSQRRRRDVGRSTARRRRAAPRRRRGPVIAIGLLVLLGLAGWQAFRAGWLDSLPRAWGERRESDRPNDAETGSFRHPGEGTGPEARDRPSPSGSHETSDRRYQCLSCGRVYQDKEMPFNRCCGYLMIELEDG